MEPTRDSDTGIQRQKKPEEERLQEPEIVIKDDVIENLHKDGDKRLLDVLAVPPDRRDEETGDIADINEVRRYFPRKYDNIEIPDRRARRILIEATKDAVADLLFFMNHNRIHDMRFSTTPKYGYRQIIVVWKNKIPVLPVILKDHPVIRFMKGPEGDEETQDFEESIM